MTEMFRMYPIMVVGDTEDVHVQCVLLLCSPGNLALGREYMFKKLLSLLAFRVRKLGNLAYPPHLFMDIAVYTAPGEQAEILTKASPVFVIRLKKFLPRGLAHPIKEVHVDRLILQE